MDDRTREELSRQLEDIARRLDRVERRVGIVPEERKAASQAALRSLDDETRGAFKAWKAAQRAPHDQDVAAPSEPVSTASDSKATSPTAASPTEEALTPAAIAGGEPAVESALPVAPPPVPHANPTRTAPPTTPPTTHPNAPPVRPLAAKRTALDEALDSARALRDRQRSHAPAPMKENIPSGGLQALESMIGGRWYAVVGAIVVVIGVGLFFKIAVQSGWIHFSPWMRCIMGAMLGAGLLGAGEWARRKISDWAAVGLSAAGLGIMYTAVFAAYQVFKLVDHGYAFIMLVAVALLGVGIGARAKLASVAIVSLIGGYLTPLIFYNVPPTPGVLPSYLLMLLAIGLLLAAWRGGTFRAVRAVAWWGTMLFGGVWVLRSGPQEPVFATLFLAMVWSGVHVSLALEAKRFGFGPDGVPEESEESETPLWKASLDASQFKRWRPLANTFSTTSWAGTLGVILVHQWQAFPDWLVPAAMCAAALGLSFALASNLRVLRDAPRNDAERLGACLAVQAGALLIAVIALSVTGTAQVLTWAAMGLAAITAARWIRSRGLDVYGLIVLSLAVLRVVIYERFVGTLTASPIEFLGLQLSAWSAVTACVGGAWAVAGWMIRRTSVERTGWRAVSHAAIAVATTLLFVALMDEEMKAISGALVAVTFGITLAVLGHTLRSVGLWSYGVLALALSSCFPAFRNWGERWTPGSGVSFLGIRLTAWSAALAYGGLAWGAAGLLARRSTNESIRRFGIGAFAVGMTLLFGALVHQGMRDESAAVIGVLLALSLFGAAIVLRSSAMLVYFGLILAGVTVFMPMRTWWQTESSGHGVEFVGLRLTAWTGVIAFAGLAWMFVARLASRTREKDSGGLVVVGGGIGLALLLASLMHESAAPASLCIAWLVLLIAAAAAGRVLKLLALDLWSIAGLAFPVLGWAWWYPAWGGWDGAAAKPGMYQGFWVGAAIAASAAVLVKFFVRAPSGELERLVRGTGWVVVAAMLFAVTSLEIGRSSEVIFSDHAAQRAAVSVWWGIFAFSMIALGFILRSDRGAARGIPVIRKVGLGLMLIATIKAIVFDLSSVPPLGRAVSFIGLGLLMLAVAVTYGKVSKRLASAAPQNSEGDDSYENEPSEDPVTEKPKSTST